MHEGSYLFYKVQQQRYAFTNLNKILLKWNCTSLSLCSWEDTHLPSWKPKRQNPVFFLSRLSLRLSLSLIPPSPHSQLWLLFFEVPSDIFHCWPQAVRGVYRKCHEAVSDSERMGLVALSRAPPPPVTAAAAAATWTPVFNIINAVKTQNDKAHHILFQ